MLLAVAATIAGAIVISILAARALRGDPNFDIDKAAKETGAPVHLEPNPEHRTSPWSDAIGPQGVVLYTPIDEERVLAVGPFYSDKVVGPPHLIIAVILVGVLGILITRPLVKRLKTLSAAADRFAQGDLQHRVPPLGNDEIGGLGRQFNGMADAIAASAESREELFREIAHELRTPLARLRFRLPDAPPEVETELREVEDLVTELVRGVIEQSARNPELHSELVVPLIRAMECEAAEFVEFDVTGAYDVIAVINRRLFQRCLVNIIRNAVRHAISKVRVVVTTDDDFIVVDVQDDGPGIPDHVSDHVLNPTQPLTKRVSSDSTGMGLGLRVALSAATRCGATLHFSTSELGGASVRTRWQATSSMSL
jgi:two-component system, OmpR family, sensor histidine kinase RstB